MKFFLAIAFAVIAAVAADVSHLPSNEYLPPVKEAVAVPAPTNEYLPPVVQEAPVQVAQVEAEPAHELAQDGYRYKTNRRVVYRRNRRDVSHLPSNEYLPPVQEQQVVVEEAAPQVYAAPVQQTFEVAQVEAEPAHELAQDGYRYKTNRRVVYRRNRRDVSHLPSNEYLPPVKEAAPLPTNEYLPPVVQEAPVQEAPIQVAQVEAEPAHELAQDGYRYKTHRRVVYRRHRRDVSHLPSNEYLPPVKEATPVQAPVTDYLPPVVQEAPVEVAQVEVEPAHELAQDGYRYKTHRRVVYRRNRRDVSHLPSNEYLPPVQEQQVVVEEAAPQVYAAPVQQTFEVAQVEAEPAHELAQDGYRYKTNRRVVYRRNRRDVSHLPSNEYLPPVQEQQVVVEEAAPQVYAAPVQQTFEVAQVEAEPAHELAQDGYRYKTHRRVVYRRH